MELIITGQKRLRDLLQVQAEIQKNNERKKKLLAEGIFNSELESFTIQAVEEDGKEILIQSKFFSFSVDLYYLLELF